ncbi:Type IV pilus biogenesis [Pseudomonas grimontii]|uniref:Type IV pilus biogenesis n=1 Tax=Pseudomonas grimontii TaxID=129847 RepID=A0ABY0TCY4_9PSED|nr:type II secretion system protein N [Pseudomonas grimontii]SDQ64218.1 Type IV pilus biogenesis [Pseudomonas grimontii]
MRPAVLQVLFLMLPLGYGLTLGWQEWQFRQVPIQAVQAVPAPVVAVAQGAALNTWAVATVFGMTAQGGVMNSAEPLTLLATVVASDSESRALLAGADGARFYRTGERLPGGSLLRRVETAQVLLWRQGREELLSLHAAGGRFLPLARAHSQAAAAVHLRPTGE